MEPMDTKDEGEEPSNANDDRKQIEFKAQLQNVKGCDPLPFSLDKWTKITEISDKMNEFMQLNPQNGFQYHTSFPYNAIPRTFEVKVGTQDIIDFNENLFVISDTTRFIEYWNDFLDEAKAHDKEEKTQQIEGEIRYDGGLSVKLNNNTLNIGDARITFQRTLRIPDDNKTYPLPPSLGSFECVKVQDYIQSVGLPPQWKKRKGVIIPMWQKEAMWMSFEASRQCAVKIGVGKINAITGKEWKSKWLSSTTDDQNYVCLPKQPWLDGINCGDGYVRQFVPMPLAKGYTADDVAMADNDKPKNVSDEEEMVDNEVYPKYDEVYPKYDVIQFEVYPKYDENIHIGVDKTQRYPEQFSQYQYNKDALYETPKGKELK
eukprot:702197_1